jgi:hypothetical protein
VKNNKQYQFYRKESTMKTQQISHFVLSACSYLRLSQAKTLSALVPAAMTLEAWFDTADAEMIGTVLVGMEKTQ